MSYFTGGEDQSNQSNGEEQQQGESTENYLERVAEAKGEKWKDPNVVAKGYLESQKFIDQLKEELEEVRGQKKQQDYMEEILAKLDSQKAQQPSGGEGESSNSASTENTGNQPGVSVEQIKSLVTETLTEQERERTAKQNLLEADRQLEAQFGTDAANVVTKRATELGLSKDRLTEIASESPTAFLALMGQAPQKETNRATTSQVNTTAGFETGSNRKDWAYYQKMRREDPKRYRSPQVQNEMLQQRLELGDRFYN